MTKFPFFLILFFPLPLHIQAQDESFQLNFHHAWKLQIQVAVIPEI